jgi:hypothetical protein
MIRHWMSRYVCLWFYSGHSDLTLVDSELIILIILNVLEARDTAKQIYETVLTTHLKY